MFLIALVLIAVPVLAQDEIPEPTSIIDVITNLGIYFGSFPGLVVLVTFVVALVLRFIPKIEGKLAKFFVALALSVIAAVVSNLANFGYLAEVTWLVAILNGAGIAVCSSLLFSVPVMKQILEWIEGQVKK